MQATFHILVKNAGNKCLVGDTLGQSFFLKLAKIPGRKPDIDTSIFLEHGLGVLPVPGFPILNV